MKCEQNYCVYNDSLKCLLEGIEIDGLGHCSECVIVTVPEEELAVYKNKQLYDMSDRNGD